SRRAHQQLFVASAAGGLSIDFTLHTNAAGALAMLTNFGRNARPEGLPPGTGATPREAVPRYSRPRAVGGTAGIQRSWRRVQRDEAVPPDSRTHASAASAGREWRRLLVIGFGLRISDTIGKGLSGESDANIPGACPCLPPVWSRGGPRAGV